MASWYYTKTRNFGGTFPEDYGLNGFGDDDDDDDTDLEATTPNSVKPESDANGDTGSAIQKEEDNYETEDEDSYDWAN